VSIQFSSARKTMNRTIVIAIFIIGLLSCESSSTVEEVVIIGGGLMGSSTGWQLSKQGKDVLLIERQGSVYTFGSSLGEARISRSLGAKGDIFSYLQQMSVAETKDLIAYLNEAEPGEPHAMEDIYRTSPVTYIRYQSQAEEVAELLADQEDPYEYATDREQARRLFGMDISDSVMVIREYKPYSGTLNPAVLISKLHQGMGQAGSRILYNEKIVGLQKHRGLYEIQIENTQSGKLRTIRSKKVVAAAGPYNGELLEEVAPYVKQLITPKRLFLAFLRIDPTVYNRFSAAQQKRLKLSYPVADINSEIFYSMIERYDDEGMPILKVGGHFLRTDIDNLDAVWEKELEQQEIAWSKENTLRYLRMLNLPVQEEDLQFISGYSCVYSLTESEIPYVANIISEDGEVDPDFVIVGGMSGVGAKGSLAYGLIASNLLLQKTDSSAMYQKAVQALGTGRLSREVNDLN